MLTQEVKFLDLTKTDNIIQTNIAPLQDLMVYLKTTETCQLNCSHCFTNGINGQQGHFNVEKTIDWFKRLHKVAPTLNNAHIAFFGGEPFLVPISMLDEVWQEVNGLWDNLWWGTTTNLTFKIDDEKLDFMKKVFTEGFGTSWDKGIRFENKKQESLWESNVRLLVDELEADLTLMVSLSKSVLEMEPIELIDFAASLGFKYLHLERLTPDGNAIQHPEIFPSNKELDAWFVKMWEQTKEFKTYEYIDNLFLNSLLTPIVQTTHAGCRCRQCEQKIFTLNATGTIGGCPNGAMESTFGTLDDDIEQLLSAPGRIQNIACEQTRNPVCYTCEVYDVCNGDCHQLAWEGDICASPKTLMTQLKNENDIFLYNKILNSFRGKE